MSDITQQLQTMLFELPPIDHGPVGNITLLAAALDAGSKELSRSR